MLQKNIIFIVSLLLSAAGCFSCADSGAGRYSAMRSEIKEYADSCDARIGVAVIVDGRDTVEVDGSGIYPMLSVFKFPQAIAVADYCATASPSLADTIEISPQEIRPDTWSPLREHYGIRLLRLPLSELLEYSLQQSDNNACDVLFRFIGGTAPADSLMKSLGYADIAIAATEDDMHRDLNLCQSNHSTPLALARLTDNYFRHNGPFGGEAHDSIRAMLSGCTTDSGRIAAPLQPAGATIAHKTGTGDCDSLGRIIAVNDVGFVTLPCGRSYSIVVLVAESRASMADTERMIAGISAIVLRHLDSTKPVHDER